MLPGICSQFRFNLLLQIFDGFFTYHVLTLGVPEANPLVRNAIHVWGDVWGLLYWKLFACGLLALVFALRHWRQALALNALTLTSAFYSCVLLTSLCEFLRNF
jgi:hypothetical protein